VHNEATPTMQRRKFIAGLGSLAAAGAAGIGTGAFTSVEANRTVDINAAGDANAYLGIAKVSGSSNSDKFVTKNGGEVAFDFSSSNDSSDLGNGFNVDAVTKVNDLLKVTNQGTQDVEFWVEAPYNSQVTNYVTLEASDKKAANTTSTDSASAGLIGDSSGSGATKVTLSPGDTIYLHLEVDSTGTSTAHGPFDGKTVTFHAEATSSSGT
jgi:hypothetical protein